MFDSPFGMGSKVTEKRQCKLVLPYERTTQHAGKSLKSLRKYQTSLNKIFLEDSKKIELKAFNMVSDEEVFPFIYNNEEFSYCNMKLHSKQMVIQIFKLIYL
jgi:hypothetical protein